MIVPASAHVRKNVRAGERKIEVWRVAGDWLDRGFESRRPDHLSVNCLNVSHLYKRKCARLGTCW